MATNTAIGRAATREGRTRTPMLIRRHLLEADRDKGDFITHIHQLVKISINDELDKLNAQAKAANSNARKIAYQWPRGHSFKSLIHNMILIGLLEKTGEREESDLIRERKLVLRTYVRIVPGAEDSENWERPMVALREIYPNLTPKHREARPTPIRPPRPPRREPKPPRVKKGVIVALPITDPEIPAPLPVPAKPGRKKKAVELTPEQQAKALLLEYQKKQKRYNTLEERLNELEDPDGKRGTDIQEQMSEVEEERDQLAGEYEDLTGEEPPEEGEGGPVRVDSTKAAAEHKEQMTGLKSRLVELGFAAEKVAKTGTSANSFLVLANDTKMLMQDIAAEVKGFKSIETFNAIKALEECSKALNRQRGMTAERTKTLQSCNAAAMNLYDILGVLDF